MARRARPLPEINGGSLADIAFLLLIFFLVTTTMDIDSGLSRKLPPWVPDEEKDKTPPIKERNVFIVLVNSNDQLLVEGKPLNVRYLKEKTKEFIRNPRNKENLPEKMLLSVKIQKAQAKGRLKEVKRLEAAKNLLGNVEISKQVISLQNDMSTSYGTYIEVQNELIAAYNEIRDEYSMQKFGKTFRDLNPKIEKDKIDAIKVVYPQSISEAEPKNIGGKK